ncbi:hypothetical protein GAGA_4084 [Paraglaciecola agarilytica NO2]|uniref:Uncharacterized protein n=1 Tax=Paraglaciecola agarilytica NO2 TaxID=1125747 RepID=A0ABQ0ICF0_9ALTE|nr:hypothetical protein GAGA_4084 [Paraglaciecola agarilytica NO2]
MKKNSHYDIATPLSKNAGCVLKGHLLMWVGTTWFVWRVLWFTPWVCLTFEQ